MRNCLVRALIICIGLGLNSVQAVPGDVIQTFMNPTVPLEGTDSFGIAVAAVGANVAVGASGDEDAGADYTGAVHLFNSATGDLVRTFLNPTPNDFDYFGSAVAALGDNVVVGAPNDDAGATNAGIAYLFESNSGTVLQTFQKPVPQEYDYLGKAVAAVGSNVLVGAPEDNTAGPNSGAAYLFNSSSGAVMQTFLNPTPQYYDAVGEALAAVGSDKVLIGAKGDNTDGQRAGAAYLFNAGTGALLRTFPNPTPADFDEFGYSVAAVGADKVLIGAPYDDTGADDAGAAYLFNVNTGQLLATIQKDSPAAYDYLGTSVAADPGGTYLMAGAPNDDGRGTNAGAVYLFSDSGEQLSVLYKPTAADYDYFGEMIAAKNEVKPWQEHSGVLIHRAWCTCSKFPNLRQLSCCWQADC